MRNRWFISDHHLWHANIIKFCKRPFANVDEMHEALVTYHNELVKPEDHVSFLGDLTILRGGADEKKMVANEIKKYNGHKRYYLGNHCHWPVEYYRQIGFEKVYATWRSEEGFICSHIPLHPRSLLTATANVHGHTHNNEKPFEPVHFHGKELAYDPRDARVVPYINVCVEVVDYRPIHLDEILARIKQCQI